MIWVQRLSADGLSLVGSPTMVLRQDLAWEFPIIEGPTMVQSQGRYWLFFGGNQWQSANYAIGMASCTSAVNLSPFPVASGSVALTTERTTSGKA